VWFFARMASEPTHDHRCGSCLKKLGGPSFAAQWLLNVPPGFIFNNSTCCSQNIYIYVKVRWSRYRPGLAQRVGRGIVLLFHDRGTRRGWVVSSTPRPHFTPGKDPVPILQEAGWAPAPVWAGGKSRPHRDSTPDRPACSQSLNQLSYPAHTHTHTHTHIYIYIYIYIYIRINRDYFSTQYQLAGLCNRNGVCFLRGSDCIFICNSG